MASPILRPAAFTSRGRRDSNQDRAFALRTEIGGQPAVLLGVADGIGGLAAGEQAAELASRVASELAPRLPQETDPTPQRLRDALRSMLLAAGDTIQRWTRETGATTAGSTLTCCLVWDHRYLVAHAGDTRCYYVSERSACCLTEDHTEAQQLVRLGRLAPGLAHLSPLQHRLTNALGLPLALQVDLVPADGEAGTADDAAVLLVCSDGVHGLVGEADFREAFATTEGPEEACHRIVALALERGSLDNASIAAVALPASS